MRSSSSVECSLCAEAVPAAAFLRCPLCSGGACVGCHSRILAGAEEARCAFCRGDYPELLFLRLFCLNNRLPDDARHSGKRGLLTPLYPRASSVASSTFVKMAEYGAWRWRTPQTPATPFHRRLLRDDDRHTERVHQVRRRLF